MVSSELPKLRTLAERMAWARQRKGWRQEDLADAARVSRDVIAKTEAGITRMPKSIEQIAGALEVPPAWLAFGAEEIGEWDADTLAVAKRYSDLPQDLKAAIKTLLDSAVPAPKDS
jgi:transcriptional regulator with XRE-family HTH domain